MSRNKICNSGWSLNKFVDIRKILALHALIALPRLWHCDSRAFEEVVMRMLRI
jgi:hypothetical protein